MNKVLLICLTISCAASTVYCGGGGGEHKVHFKAEYPYHTIHKHHTEKIPDVKIIEVPVVKEVKVLEPYKVPYKVKVPFLVKQHLHTVVKEHHSHPVHTSEHVHHKPVHHSQSHAAYEGISSSYGSHADSDLAPLYVSHTPVHQSSYDAPSSYHGSQRSVGLKPISTTKDSYPAYSHDFHSRLNTGVPINIGFGSNEGKSMNYEVKESPEVGPVLFGRATKSLSGGSMTEAKMRAVAYPYPLPQDETKNSEFLFGFDPKASSYDFTDL